MAMTSTGKWIMVGVGSVMTAGIIHNQKLTAAQKLLAGAGVATMAPIWRSGAVTGLTFWEFLLNHTIWGPPVEYVPEEDYTAALCPVTGITRKAQ